MKNRKLLIINILICCFISITKFSYGLDKIVNKIIEQKYSEIIPKSVKVNIKNSDAQPEYLNYAFIKTIDAPIRVDATIHSKEIVRFPFNTKIKVLEKVRVNKNEWYKVEIKDTDGSIVNGYISALLTTFREFRFKEMNDRIIKLSNFMEQERKKGRELVSINTYIPNPSNKNMKRDEDMYGTAADQNAKANFKGKTIYIPDRSIISIVSKDKKNLYVNALSISKSPLKVNKKDITRYPKITKNFRKVIVIDLKNQNEGVFQKNSENEWELISYTLNKTGAESQLGFETPRGYFIVPVVKYEMGYRDIYNNSSGIAKYAIRFTGGGYIHGTPINFDENINRDFFLGEKDGTLGTVEGTRKCIRNMESHVKFLFDWITNGKVNRFRNEQKPDENVMVIVF